MSPAPEKALLPKDSRASIAVDLGAESCRVSLLRWVDGVAAITLVHRFANHPRESGGALRWDLKMIEAGLDEGLRLCAAIATEGVRSIAVDGWAVDYVRVGADGKALDDPFCYRDERTVHSEAELHTKISPERMREITGIQLLRLNTVYQLYADKLQKLSTGERWLNLPEYILSRWGGKPVAEYTNATHTQLVEINKKVWSREIFQAAELDVELASGIVPPGTVLGTLQGELAELPALRDVQLIAPGCHDTASAIAGIPAHGDDWAYISSGTWSLVGTLVDEPKNDKAVRADNFNNLAGVGGKFCFHKNVNGMWLIQQCLEQWESEGTKWSVADLVAAASKVVKPEGLLDVDDPDLLLAGKMPQRINAQREANGFAALDEGAENAPVFASLIFHSLAARYAEVLKRIAVYSGKTLKRIFIVGGASQNVFLNRLVQEATELEVFRGCAESSTVGNFAVQLAVLENESDAERGVHCEDVSAWAGLLADAFPGAPRA